MGTGAEEIGAEVAPKEKKAGVYVKVPVGLHRQLKAEAALLGKDLGELAEELLEVGIRHSPQLKVVNGGYGEG